MVTRTTTTTTTSSAILLNTGYLKTLPGLLKLVQVVIGAIVVGLLASYSSYWAQVTYTGVPILFLLLIATSCLIATGCLLISCLLSISTATIVAKTMFMPVLLVPETLLYLCASLYHLSTIAYRNSGYDVAEYGYGNQIFAGALGAVNTILYCVSTIIAFRNYRRV